MGQTGSGSGTEQAVSEARALSHDLVCILEGFLSHQVEEDWMRGKVEAERSIDGGGGTRVDNQQDMGCDRELEAPHDYVVTGWLGRVGTEPGWRQESKAPPADPLGGVRPQGCGVRGWMEAGPGCAL